MIGLIVKAAIVALILAVYDLFLKNLYYDWVKTTTGNPTIGLGEAALGYFLPILSGYIIAALIVRRVRGEE